MIFVASPEHPLAKLAPPLPLTELAKYVQLVLTDRSTLSQGRDFRVISYKTWRLADLGAKHVFLRAGLGWGSRPEDVVASDIRNGLLTEIRAENEPLDGYSLTMSAVYRTYAPPGPAGRWFIERLRSQIIPASQTALEAPGGGTIVL